MIKKFNPYSDNIIFLDTEFSSLDPNKGEILSIGLIKYQGDELYLELEHQGYVSDWAKENIVPKLKGQKVPRHEAVDLVWNFVGNNTPYFISYVVQYDAPYLKKLFNVGDLAHNNDAYPFHWLSIDFAAILFALGIRPEDFTRNRKEFCSQFPIDLDQYEEHNALDDARLLRDIYFMMINNKK